MASLFQNSGPSNRLRLTTKGPIRWLLDFLNGALVFRHDLKNRGYFAIGDPVSVVDLLAVNMLVIEAFDYFSKEEGRSNDGVRGIEVEVFCGLRVNNVIDSTANPRITAQ